MGIHFLTPLAAALAVAAALPLLGWALRERKDDHARLAMGLGRPRRLLRAETGLYSVAAIAALAVAAAQPTFHRYSSIRVRTESEAYFVFDTSRSMLARRRPKSPSRFERATTVGLRMRRDLADVRVGVGSLTDRPLPHLLPTPDEQAFAAVVQQAIGIDKPPPEQRVHLATDYASLADIGNANWFDPGISRRLVVLFTDGETRDYLASQLLSTLHSSHVSLIAVRVSRSGESIYLRNGTRDPGYRFDPSTSGLSGLRAFGENQVGAAVRAARAVVDRGPRAGAGRVDRTTPLGRYAVLAAALPITLLLFRRR